MCAQVRWYRPSVCLFIVLSALPFGTLPAASAGEVQWVEVRSPNFSVVTDSGEKRGREVAMRFEQMRAVFGTLMTKAKVNLAVPLQIVAFRNTKEMRQVAPLWNGKPTQLAGLFQGGQDRSFIMLDMSVENPYSVVFHEYAHQLMNGNLQEEVDPWFEEGFAEYFSSIEVDGKQVRVGKIPEDEYRILQQFGMMKIADLFKVVHDSATYNESGDHRTSFYAGSAILMHYLYDNQLTAKIATYFQLKVNQHVPVEEAIQRAFGMSPPEFDKVLRNYVSAGRYRYYPVPTPPAISSDKFTVIPLKSTDSASVLADIHLHSRDYQERARNEFQEILKADPNNAAACRGLGYGYLQQQDFTQAAEYFKRASQLDSRDPRVHYYYALLLFREGHLSSGADAPVMAKELETAISLDPGFADSYALLAFAQMTIGDSAKALSTMQKALELSPRDESYLYNLANLYLANRQPDQAIAILTSLRVTDNPALAAQVAAMLAQVQQFQKTAQTDPNGSEPLMVLSRREGPETAIPLEEEVSPSAAPVKKDTKWGSPKFIHGILSSVDCSAEPAAVLTLLVGAKTLKLTLADRSQVIMIGSDQFSCSWSKRKVAVNYRESGTGETSVMSVELQ
jgi:tetratricopeptide (TPR) repeat protein